MTPTAGNPGRRWWGRLVWFCAAFLLLSSLLAALLLTGTPRVVQLPPPGVADAERARDLAKRLRQGLESREPTLELRVSQQELQSLLILAARGLPRLAGEVTLAKGQLLLAASLRLPPTAQPLYLNGELTLLPSREGLRLAGARLGRLPLPEPLARWLLGRGLDLGLGRGGGAALLAAVHGLEVAEHHLQIRLKDVRQLQARLQQLPTRLARLREWAMPLAAPWPRETVQLYLGQLRQITANAARSGPAALTDYLGPLFQLARERSRLGDPVRENQAALLALAGYLGHWRFVRLLDPSAPRSQPRSQRAPSRVSLANRDDLRRHFVISAGLQLLADQGATAAVGEWKELLDAGGGSGFSFADLAADRAGSALARTASDPQRARRLQGLLAAGGEAVFFPPLDGLPENLSQAEFAAHFGSVDSPAYLELVALIDARLAACAIHRP